MTTTAHEDQFTIGTQTIEPVRQPYNTVSILRRNIAALEVALRQQTELAEAAEAELAAEIERTNETISRLSVEWQDAVEM